MEIVQPRTYSNVALLVHQCSLNVYKNSKKVVENHSNTTEDYVVYYDGFVVGEGVPDHADLRLGRRIYDTPVYVLWPVLGFCGKTALSFVHLSAIEHLRYVELDELMSGRIWDVKAAVYRGNYVNAFLGRFVNNELVVNKTMFRT